MKLLVLTRSVDVYNRIVQPTQEAYVVSYIRNLSSLQTWMTQNEKPFAALLDLHWAQYQETVNLLSRLAVPVMDFSGEFPLADAWLESKIAEIQQLAPAKQQTDATTQGRTVPTHLTQDDTEEQPPNSSAKINSPLPTKLGGKNPFLSKPAVPVRDTVYQTAEVPPKSDTLRHPEEEQTNMKRTDLTELSSVQAERIVALRSKLIVVVNMWPRAGATFLSAAISHMLAEHLPAGSVTLLEHSNQTPAHWNYFRLYNLYDEASYVHWVQDGRGEAAPLSGVDLVPLRTDHVPSNQHNDALFQYLYRVRKPFVVIDAGANLSDHNLLGTADVILVVMDCDPVKLDLPQTIATYESLKEKYDDVRILFNKWSRYVGSLEAYGTDCLYVPYILPELVHKSLWAAQGNFITASPEVRAQLSIIETHLINEWLPEDIRRKTTEHVHTIRNLFRGRREPK